MQSRMAKYIVLNALLMAVWRRNPQKQVLVHSVQGSKYTSHEWQSFHVLGCQKVCGRPEEIGFGRRFYLNPIYSTNPHAILNTT